MPSPLTRQDILAITDGAKNKIIERMVTRNEVQGVVENARDRLMNTINAFHVETQSTIRQTNNQTNQTWRRVATLESQVAAARQEIRMLIQAVNRLYDLQSQQVNRMQTQPPAEYRPVTESEY
jgi:hypothetical protein